MEIPYIRAVNNEWKQYKDIFAETPKVKEIHLGGGTPTFFSPNNLLILLERLFKELDLAPDCELSFEGHPNSTTKEHLRNLYDIGFRRMSLGIQDFDPKVQEIVNRIQTFDTVKRATLLARDMGYTSINHDLIYGLPLQTLTSVQDTINKIGQLMPDRIAFYSYAHVPWLKPGQRKFTELDLPSDEVKRNLYETGRAMLENMGYKEIGMDHFALETDSLYKAAMGGTLHRNFMGYTPSHSAMTIGLGTSAISDTWNAFAQNVKKVEEYLSLVKQAIPVFRGHILTDEDMILRKHILNIMCQYRTDWSDPALQTKTLYEALPRLTELVDDELVIIEGAKLEVTEAGKAFIRNICMAFDARIWASQPGTLLFSKTI